MYLRACKQLLRHASIGRRDRPSALGALMRHLMANTGRDFFHEVERLDLSLSQIKTLQFMADHEPGTLRAISDELGLSLPGVSRAIDGLHKRGIVKRTEDPDDRRARCLTLTAKGARTMEGWTALRLAGIRAVRGGPRAGRARGAVPGLKLLAERPEIAAHPPEARR